MYASTLDCVAAYENIVASGAWDIDAAHLVLASPRVSEAAVRRLVDSRLVKIRGRLLLPVRLPRHPLAPRTFEGHVKSRLVLGAAIRSGMAQRHLGDFDKYIAWLGSGRAYLAIHPRQPSERTPPAVFGIDAPGAQADVLCRAAYLLWCQAMSGEWRRASYSGLEEWRPLYQYAVDTPPTKRHGCTNQWNCCRDCRYRRQLEVAASALDVFAPAKVITVRPPTTGSMSPAELVAKTKDCLNRVNHHAGIRLEGALIVASRQTTDGRRAGLHAHAVLDRNVSMKALKEHAAQAGILHSQNPRYRRPDATGQGAMLYYVLTQALTDDPSFRNRQRAPIWTPSTRYRHP